MNTVKETVLIREIRGLNINEALAFIFSSLIRRSEPLAVALDAWPRAAPVSRKRSLHLVCCHELLRPHGALPRASAHVRNQQQTRRGQSTTDTRCRRLS